MNKQLISSHIPGITFLHAHLDGLVARTVANAYWKDRTNQYLGANDSQVVNSGIESHADLIGATDHDLSWKEFAPLLMAHDNRVIAEEKPTIFIEPVRISQTGLDKCDQLSNYLSYKSPLLNRDGKVIGIFGLSYLLNGDISHEKILDEFALMAGIYGREMVRKLLLRHQCLSHHLTPRQLECLERLARGMTMKQIGDSLSLSSRTVEHYLEAVKLKLNCSSRIELIQAAVNMGLLDIL